MVREHVPRARPTRPAPSACTLNPRPSRERPHGRFAILNHGRATESLRIAPWEEASGSAVNSGRADPAPRHTPHTLTHARAARPPASTHSFLAEWRRLCGQDRAAGWLAGAADRARGAARGCGWGSCGSARSTAADYGVHAAVNVITQRDA